jgi:hypothetical protein
MTGPSARSANVVIVGEAKKVCFVVSPMGDRDSLERIHADWLVSEIIEPVVREVPGFIVKRADHHKRTSPIDAQVMHYLLNSELVIADLSTHDPYVFYDIAIRHISRKPIIHMHRDGEKLPFDAGLCESIGFSRLKPSDLRTARTHLRQVVESVLEEGYEVVNPISQFFSRVQVTPISAAHSSAPARSQPSLAPVSIEPAAQPMVPSTTSQRPERQRSPERSATHSTAPPSAASVHQMIEPSKGVAEALTTIERGANRDTAAPEPNLHPVTPQNGSESVVAAGNAKGSPEGLDDIKARLEARLEEMQASGHEKSS